MGIFDRLSKNNSQPESHVQAPTAPPTQRGISLKKEAGISLKKNNLEGVRAAVYLVLDHSGSMHPYYKNHTVQDFTEKVLAIGNLLDDDGEVPIILFDTYAREPHVAHLDNSEGVVDAMLAKAGHMGTTNYAAAMQAVIKHYAASGAKEPALVIFQTDGSPDSRKEAERVMCEAANLPIFWKFVGFGNDEFAFLKKLDDLAVPQKRVIDNADFFPAGNNPKNIVPSELYDNLLNEFPDWLKQAKAQGIVQA